MPVGEKTKLLWQNPEYRKHMSEAHKGYKPSEEHKRKISEGLKESYSSGRRINFWKGKIIPKKIRLKISFALSGGKTSDEKNGFWKGDDVRYRALHSWIERNLGKPTRCEHCGKDDLSGNGIHWANKDHQYKRNLDDWLRLCAFCHKKYDKERIMI